MRPPSWTRVPTPSRMRMCVQPISCQMRSGGRNGERGRVAGWIGNAKESREQSHMVDEARKVDQEGERKRAYLDELEFGEFV
jgi:hypothetical protein